MRNQLASGKAPGWKRRRALAPVVTEDNVAPWEVSMRIDLNCDMGESFGAYRIGMDEDVMPFITSANIACGYHGGDPLVMDRTVKMAKAHAVGIGAHPGFPDLMGFGRRNMDCTQDEIRSYIIYQVGALQGFCRANGVSMAHVKPHGNLYNMALDSEPIATAIVQGILAVDSTLLYVALAGARGERARRIGQEMGLKVVYEAFPDRAYTPQGGLVPRREQGAVIHDPEVVARRALLMAAEHKVVAVDGTVIPLEVQTLCVHGDNPAAVALVRSIRKRLEAEGIAVRPMGG